MQPIQLGESFKDNLAQLPAIDGIERLELLDANGAVVASIENAPGKQGSLALYRYLALCFGRIDAAAAEHGLLAFAEHTADARSRPGAHPNVDRLLEIAAGGETLDVRITPSS